MQLFGIVTTKKVKFRALVMIGGLDNKAGCLQIDFGCFCTPAFGRLMGDKLRLCYNANWWIRFA